MKINFKQQSKGAILIEFAFCMPVLILLIYYMHDLFKIQRYYSQTEFVAYQMVQMIQSISQNRESKTITANDLRYITSAAYLTIFPGTTMFWQGKGLHFVCAPHPLIYYVKGNSDGTATTVWGIAFWTSESTVVSPAKMKIDAWSSTHDLSRINMGTNVPPSQIYPTLKIKPGEVKIIVEAVIFFHTGFKDVNGKSGYTPQKVFGCHLLSPKHWRNQNGYLSKSQRMAFFNSVVIFSPNPGLFSETAPLD